MSRKDEIAVKKHHDLVNMEYENGLDTISTKIGAICKTIFSPKLCVLLKILSSEYQSYACVKIFRMP